MMFQLKFLLETDKHFYLEISFFSRLVINLFYKQVVHQNTY